MSEVYPIKDTTKIKEIREYLSKNPRDELLFIMGINTGLRISDLLKLKFSDFFNSNNQLKYNNGICTINIIEKKTSKPKKFYSSELINNLLVKYFEFRNFSLDEYIFIDEKHEKKNVPISRQRVWKLFQEASEECSLDINIGTHTLRKTFGYHVYKKNRENKEIQIIDVLQKIFQHSSKLETFKYIGMTDELIQKVYCELELG